MKFNSFMYNYIFQKVFRHYIFKSFVRQFHKEHGFREVKPKLFTTLRFQKELDLLYREAELFRKSPVTTMTEQSFVVKKFFISMVSKARNIFFNANQEANRWAKEVISPLKAQIKEHKLDIEKRLLTLRKISQSRDTLEGKIAELEKSLVDLEQQISAINLMLEVVKRPFVPPVNDSQQAADAS